MKKTSPSKAKKIILIGAGGHARVLHDALRRSSISVVGATDPQHKRLRSENLPFQLLGDDSALDAYTPKDVLLVNGIGSVGIPQARRTAYERFKRMGYSFLTVIDPSAVLASTASCKEGAQILAGAVLQSGVIIGENAIINTRASVDHDSQVGSHCHVAPGTVLCGAVRLGDTCHIGAGSVLVQGTRIPSNTFIKAMTLVKPTESKKGRR